MINIKTWTVLLLPCLAAAQMRVEIVPGENDNNPNVVVSGSDRQKATEIDLAAFHLTEDGVRGNLYRLGWHGVDELIISHSSAHGYKDLYITLRPKLARILRSNDKIVKYNKKTFRNVKFSPRVFRPELEQDVKETMTTKWHDFKEISVGNNIDHVVGFNRIVHASRYGHEDFESRTLTVKAETEDEVYLKTGQAIRAGLEVKETTLEVRIDYEVSLDGEFYFGYLCTSFIFRICSKHLNLDVNEYFKMLDYPPVIKLYEIVKFTYYHDPVVSVGEAYYENEE